MVFVLVGLGAGAAASLRAARHGGGDRRTSGRCRRSSRRAWSWPWSAGTWPTCRPRSLPTAASRPPRRPATGSTAAVDRRDRVVAPVAARLQVDRGDRLSARSATARRTVPRRAVEPTAPGGRLRLAVRDGDRRAVRRSGRGRVAGARPFRTRRRPLRAVRPTTRPSLRGRSDPARAGDARSTGSRRRLAHGASRSSTDGARTRNRERRRPRRRRSLSPRPGRGGRSGSCPGSMLSSGPVPGRPTG